MKNIKSLSIVVVDGCRALSSGVATTLKETTETDGGRRGGDGAASGVSAHSRRRRSRSYSPAPPLALLYIYTRTTTTTLKLASF